MAKGLQGGNSRHSRRRPACCLLLCFFNFTPHFTIAHATKKPLMFQKTLLDKFPNPLSIVNVWNPRYSLWHLMHRIGDHL